MFMLMASSAGVIRSKQINLPITLKSLNSPHQKRSRAQWMDKMNVEAFGWKSAHYAFRYKGEWHLCSAHGHHEPIRSIPDGDDARSAAEMWLIAKATRG